MARKCEVSRINKSLEAKLQKSIVYYFQGNTISEALKKVRSETKNEKEPSAKGPEIKNQLTIL